MSNHLLWVIIVVLALIVVLLLVVLSKSKNRYQLERNKFVDMRSENDRFHEREPYYVDPADRSALATFCADHLDDVNHPNRADVVRILAAWGAVG